MPGNVSIDTQKLQNIKTALQQFNSSMQSNSLDILGYLSEKKKEVETNLNRKLRQFEANELYRKQAEYNAEGEYRDGFLEGNSLQRQREIDELYSLKSLIRTFDLVSSELEQHLKTLTRTHGETVEKGVSTLEKSIQLIEEYFAVSMPGSSNVNNGLSQTSKKYKSSTTVSPAIQMRAYAHNWVTGLSDQQKNAIHDYTKEFPPYYKNINGVLRGYINHYDEGNEERSCLIHQALSTARTPCDITVYRGCSSKALGDLAFAPDESLVNCIFEDMGFASTSMSQNSAFGGDTLLEIHLPAGSHAANIESLSMAGGYEEEVLIDCGQMFRIDGVRRDINGRRIVEATAII